MPILYESYAEPQVKTLARTKDTEKTLTITLAVGKGVIVEAYAQDEAGATITKAYVGQKIYAHVKVRNDGDDDYIWYTVTDKDTGAIIDQPAGNPFIIKGAFLDRVGAALTMPEKNWNWLVEAGHGKP